MNENDLRVQRTRRLLRNAFLKLANDRDFGDITIRDVTRAAQVGYKTFFRHYDSIDSLLQAIIDQYLVQFEQAARPMSQPDAVEENTRYALRLVSENRQLFLAILNSPKSLEFLRPVMAHAYQDSVQMLSHSDVPADLIGYHFSTSLVSLFKWWLEQDGAYTVEEMHNFIVRLVVHPIKQH